VGDTFSLQGSLGLSGGSGAPSGALYPVGGLNETLVVQNSVNTIVSLDGDAAVPVPFGTMTAAHVVSLDATGGPVTARITSEVGAQQLVPFDDYFFTISRGKNITAIDLIRTPGTPTTVRVFIAQKA
jgi:hypothetical protein